MLKSVVTYLIGILKRHEKLVIYFRRADHIRRAFEAFLLRHVRLTLVIAGLAVIALLVSLIGPPTPSCGYVARDSVFTSTEDNLKFYGSRPCESRKLIAFEVINRDTESFPSGATKQNIVSADLFIKAKVIREGDELRSWRNFSIYSAADAGGNDFTLRETRDNDEVQYRFAKNTCNSLEDEASNHADFQNTKGFEIEGVVPFPGRSLSAAQHKACRFARDTPEYAACNFSFLHLYIPSIEPKLLCEERTWLDDWINPGVKRHDVVDKKVLEQLHSFAKSRFEETKVQAMEDSQWQKATKGLPRFCGRRLGQHGEDKGVDSIWEDEGSIVSVWCDH